VNRYTKSAHAYRGDHAAVTTAERVISVNLSAEDWKLLDLAARAKNVTRRDMARRILVAHLRGDASILDQQI
jgi:hypothetical protein